MTFDSRLAGSPNGVAEGEMFTGGLNAPLPMPAAPLADNELAADSPSLAQLELTPLEPDVQPRRKTPAAGAVSPMITPGPAMATASASPDSARGASSIRGVAVKVGDPQFTLIWNTDGVDLDLHVLEPSGKEIYWEEPKGIQGGELDVDNTKGFGPENVYWMVESQGPGYEKVKGPGPRNLQVVCRLLGRIRRDRQADPLAGPRQTRRQGQCLPWQVQSPERAKQDLHAQGRARGLPSRAVVDVPRCRSTRSLYVCSRRRVIDAITPVHV